MKIEENSQVLVLSASYGAGHDSAASAVVEECRARGMKVRQVDLFALAHVPTYGFSKAFYQFCVLHAPRMWSWLYEQVDRWDWHHMAHCPPQRQMMQALKLLVQESGAELVICTYPLFSYMLDVIREEGNLSFSHVAVITDAMGVSRIWLRSRADALFVTDAYTKAHIEQRYALDESLVQVSSFPIKAKFYPQAGLNPPGSGNLAILYAAQAPLKQVKEELLALLKAYPKAKFTILGGKRYTQLVNFLDAQDLQGVDQLYLIERSEHMDELMRSHHLYIGKAGGATTFEVYACAIPMLVNYAHLEQELGNVELLQRDACGIHAEGAAAVLAAVQHMLARQAQQWCQMRANMLQLPRRGGAARLMDALCPLMNQQ